MLLFLHKVEKCVWELVMNPDTRSLICHGTFAWCGELILAGHQVPTKLLNHFPAQLDKGEKIK